MAERIGDLLVDTGVISRETLERVLAARPSLHERRVLSELYALRLVDERPLCEVLARHAGSPVVILSESAFELRALAGMPEALVREHVVLPLAVDEVSITVAMSDVDAGAVIDAIAFATGRRVVPVLGVRSVLQEAIDFAYALHHGGDDIYIGKRTATRTPHLVLAGGGPDQEIDVARLPRTLGRIKLKQVALNGTLASALDGNQGLAPVVLVVDDDAEIRGILRAALSHDGLRVVEAPDGDEAARILRVLRPALVVLDAQLPGVHGFELCAAMKRSQLKDVPVVMISAIYRGWQQQHQIHEVYGADSFVEKPFELPFVRRLIGDLLKRAPGPRTTVADVAGRVEGAIRAFEKHVAEGNWPDAALDLDLWLGLDPFDARAWIERGHLCARAGDVIGALPCYEAAAVYEPAAFVAQAALAMACDHLGFARRAQVAWERARACAADPESKALAEARLARFATPPQG